MNKRVRKIIQTTMLVFLVTLVFNMKSMAATSLDTYFDNAQSLQFDNQVTGQLSSTNQKQCYSFTTTSNKSYYKISGINSTCSDSIYFQLYNADRSILNVGVLGGESHCYIAENDKGEILLELAQNTKYYIIVEPDWTSINAYGNFLITLTELKDDVADTYNAATELQLNQVQQHTIQTKRDIDYFWFKTNGITTDYTIQASLPSASDSITYEIYDKDLLRIGYPNSVYYYTGGNSDKVSLNKNSVYYIKVTGAQAAEYTLKINCKTETKYKIAYKLNGGTNNSNNPSTYTKAETVKLQNPTKNGSVFKGWYTDKSYKNSIKKINKGSTKNYTLYAKWEKIKLAKVSIDTLKNSGKSKIKLSVNKVTQAKGYEVVIASDKKMTIDKVTYNTKKTSTTINALVKGNTYYVQVRAYSQDSNGNIIYGKYSAIKKVKITK